MNLDWLTCIQKFGVSSQVVNKTWFNIIQRKGSNSHLNLKLNHVTLMITLQMHCRNIVAAIVTLGAS
jgi:hypothetical protein